MKTFIYKDQRYIRAIPGKMLFRSNMVHEVVNRGDIFALNVDTQELTIVPGRAEVEHGEHTLVAAEGSKPSLALKKLRAIRDLLDLGESFASASAAVERANKDAYL